MQSKQKPIIAAFDFDGTLTYHDSFRMFLVHTFGWGKLVLNTLPLLPLLALYAVGKASRTAVKEAYLTQFFKGMPIEKVEKLGAAFSAKMSASQFRPEALARLHWHQNQGHRCFIVSASVDIWLRAWAEKNGIEQVVASRLEVDEEGRVTGRLRGNNCRREEKVRRLTEVLGALGQYEMYAYGDTAGDKEMLAVADHPYYRRFSD